MDCHASLVARSQWQKNLQAKKHFVFVLLAFLG